MNEAFRSHNCGALREEHIGLAVRLAGWCSSFRNHGGVIFVDLRDAYGVTQLVLHDDTLLLGLARESVVTVAGTVVARDAETVNPKIATGTVEVHVDALTPLSDAPRNLPFEVNGTDHVREDLRLKYRYLDLRGARMQRNLQVRAALLRAVRKQMEGFGFLEVQTPILTASSPEGARDYLVPSRKYKDKFYALPQAPQQFKQLLMLGGVDRYYQIAPCFRDEDARNDRTPGEFYQIDFEMAFATQEDVLAVAEQTLHSIFLDFTPQGSQVTALPFPRISYRDAMLRYGTDKPDLRNPLTICDLTDFFAQVDFKPFRARPVRGIVVPQCALQPKSFFEQMLKFAAGIGMAGLGYISIAADGELKGPIAKFLTAAQQQDLVATHGMQPQDTLFFICDKPAQCSKLAGQIRTELGRALDLIDKNRFAFCFVTDFPLYEQDAVTGQLGFMHNPFSMPQGGLDALTREDPLTILAHQYDVVVNGVELSSGAVRNHQPAVMQQVFALAGYSETELQARFGALYGAFQHGAPPHAGMAHGLDRMLMLLLDEESIREVLAFPLSGAAQDLLLGAPSAITALQRKELHLPQPVQAALSQA